MFKNQIDSYLARACYTMDEHFIILEIIINTK